MTRDLSLYEYVPPRRIDYALMRQEYPKVKGALTRATNSGDPVKVLSAVERFIQLSDDCGAMPDDWSRWANALEAAHGQWERMILAQEDALGSDVWYLPNGHFLLQDQLDRFRAAARRFR